MSESRLLDALPRHAVAREPSGSGYLLRLRLSYVFASMLLELASGFPLLSIPMSQQLADDEAAADDAGVVLIVSAALS